MTVSKRPRLGLLLIAGLVLLTAIGVYKTTRPPPPYVAVTRRPAGIMGTECLLVAVVPGAERSLAEPALDAAERELRAVEALMSTWIESTEISRLNRAKAGERITLSPPSLEVLRAAQRLNAETGGAFDVTCRPLIELWRRAGRRGTLPSSEAIESARRASNWEGLVLEAGGARKLRDPVRVDLGGIAKGYAIDRALEAMIASGVEGALVDVGGDLRCWGRSPMEGSAHWQEAFLEVHPRGWPWSIEIQSPFGSDPQGSLRLREGAVCTSGGYARFVEIEGQRYSHIVDPRTGQPADELTSVTVIAPDALTADAWATALSILGPEGFALIGDAAIRALLVRGRPESLEVFTTDGVLDSLEGWHGLGVDEFHRLDSGAWRGRAPPTPR